MLVLKSFFCLAGFVPPFDAKYVLHTIHMLVAERM